MKFDSDVKDPKYLGLYGPAQPQKTPDGKAQNPPSAEHMDNWLTRTAELVHKYKPEVVWFDWWIEQPVFQPYLKKFAAFYYNRGAEWKRGGVAINYKNKSFPDKAAVLDIERGKLDKMHELMWQTDTSIGLKSWSHIEGEEFRTANSVVDELVDIVSKNGLLLLNIGPRADGTISGSGGEYAARDREMAGDEPRSNLWNAAVEGLRRGTHASAVGWVHGKKQKPFTAGDVRFTQKGGNLYAIFMDWPAGESTIKAINAGSLGGKKIASVALLGSKDKINWKLTDGGLNATWPKEKSGDYAHVLRVSLK